MVSVDVKPYVSLGSKVWTRGSLLGHDLWNTHGASGTVTLRCTVWKEQENWKHFIVFSVFFADASTHARRGGILPPPPTLPNRTLRHLHNRSSKSGEEALLWTVGPNSITALTLVSTRAPPASVKKRRIYIGLSIDSITGFQHFDRIQ